MVKHMCALSTALTLVLMAGTSSLSADETKRDRTEALAAKLGLNDQQKAEINKIYADLEAKMEPLEHQLWQAHRETRAAVHKLLTDEQRTKFPDVIKEERSREFQSIATKLGLNEEQRERVHKTMMDYHKKFHEVAAQQPDDARKQFRELKHEFLSTVCKELTDEQRIRLPQVLRMEFDHLTNPQLRNEHVKAIESKLSLTDEQKTQVEKILADCTQRIEKPVAQIKALCDEENNAIEKVLTKEQAAKLEEIMKTANK